MNIPAYIDTTRNAPRQYRFDVVEADIDARFNAYCRRIGTYYLLFYALDVAFVVYVYAFYWGHLALLLLSFVALSSIALHAAGHRLLRRPSANVRSMMWLRSPRKIWQAAHLSPVAKYKYLTASWSVANWQTLSYSTVCATVMLGLVVALLYEMIHPFENLGAIVPFVAIRLLEASLLWYFARSFYGRAVVASVAAALPSEQSMRAYARSRSANNVNALLKEARRAYSDDAGTADEDEDDNNRETVDELRNFHAAAATTGTGVFSNPDDVQTPVVAAAPYRGRKKRSNHRATNK
jgi:hypothetical protein